MKTLVQITTMVNSGSVGRIAEEIGALAIVNGWQSYIAFGRNPRPSKSKLIKIGTDIDVKLHGFKTRLFDKHGFGSRTATFKLVEKLKKIKPDIVHLHCIHGYYINMEVLFNYLAQSGIPVVWTLHDCWSMTGHCVHFENLGCERWKTGCYDCPDKSGYPSSLFIDNSKNNYRRKKVLFNSVKNLTLVPVCDWLDKLVKESFLKDKNSKVIYNGIDYNLFSPQEPSKTLQEKLGVAGKFVALSVSSVWSSTKGMNDLIELSKQLDQDIKIIMVGVTAQQMKELPPDIITIEHTESVEQLAELYSLADVFINPTYQDTLPTVNIESIACGTPVITYHTGGSADIINDQTGIVVPVGDKRAMINAIIEIKEKGKNNYSQHCRNRALQMFRKEERFVEYLSLYGDLIK